MRDGGPRSVDLAGLEVLGISVGGIETCIEVPSYKLAFDVGRCPRSVIARPTILFTHAHADHMGGVVQHTALRAMRRMEPPTYVVPREDAAAFRDMFEAWRVLDRSELPHHLVELGPGEEYPLGRGLVAEAFRSPHSAPCQGYVVWREARRLRAEFVGLPGDELGRRRRAGEQIERVTRIPELAFTGDTQIDVLDREPILRRVRRLILEVTFLDDRVSVASAREKGHVHLDEVIERAELFENEAILLTHFSARYRAAEVREILDRRLPADLRERVTPLLAGLR
ncbi:MAG: MBL fold metallo-hydrolase [Planctomycetota bacterium]